jgi:PAS domain S-box-containing protein
MSLIEERMSARTKSDLPAKASIVQRYMDFVRSATAGNPTNNKKDIGYWRERLFTQFITYLLPTCLIALVPGVFMSYIGGFYFIAFTDIFAVSSIAFVALNTRLSLRFRKRAVIAILYFLSIALIVDLSLLGPGMVYLLALSVLITIIFPRNWGYWSVGANFVICACCALVIHFELFNSALTKDYGLGAWIAVSSNIVFLSLVMVVLVESIIKGFEMVIGKEIHANDELQKELLAKAQANILLSESDSHFKSLFFMNPSPMWVLDRESLQFLQVNDAAIRQYGYTDEEFLSMNIKDIKLEKDSQTLMDDLDKNLETGKPLTIVTRHRRKSREEFFAEVTFNTIMFQTRPATLVISQDITKQVEYIKAIEDQNNKFKEIAHIQSHEVRGPLATILGLTQLFNDNTISTDTEAVIQGIQTSSVQLDKVIREIVQKTSIAQIQDIPTRQFDEHI